MRALKLKNSFKPPHCIIRIGHHLTYIPIWHISDHEAVSESSRETPHLHSSLKQEAKSETAVEQGEGLSIKPGMDKVLGKNKQSKTAAVPINLDSECESFEVSGGGDVSDEDDFDFYDKF